MTSRVRPDQAARFPILRVEPQEGGPDLSWAPATSMPPKRGAGGGQGDVQGGKSKRRRASSELAEAETSDLFVASNDDADEETEEDEVTAARVSRSEADEDQELEKSIPMDLLTRLLHEFFAKDMTRISRNANAAVGKYVDVFVREAIARASVCKQGGFLEVEDLEKIAPQLLLDL